MQDMRILAPHQTTFIIISSDQDFRNHMQLLINQGFKVIIMHNAPPGKWRETLEMQASESYVWNSIIEDGFASNTGTSAVGSLSEHFRLAFTYFDLLHHITSHHIASHHLDTLKKL